MHHEKIIIPKKSTFANINSEFLIYSIDESESENDDI